MAAISLGIGELLARHSIDLKYYDSDSEVGYYLLPNQRGGSRLVGSYAVNSDGLGVAEPFSPSDRFDLLLVGDSIVLGSSRVEQHERLGPQIEQRATDWEVWPLAAGSWSLWNELRMIARNPKLEQVDAIVFVLNRRDFEHPSYWRSQFNHPREKPDSYLLYGLLKKFPVFRPPERPVPVRQSDLRADWKAFRSRFTGQVYVVGYDGLETSGSRCNWLPDWIDAPSNCFDPVLMGHRQTLVDPMHLDASGNAILAEFIENLVARSHLTERAIPSV